MPRTCRSAPVITAAPIPCSFRISAASQSVAVGLIVTTSLPLWDRIALTVMGILREHRRPLYRNLELCVGETAPREPFDKRRLPCPLISSPSAILNALIKSKAARRARAFSLRSSLIAVAVTAERAAAPVLLASRPSGLHGIEGLGRTRVHPRAAEIARVRPEPRFAVRIIEAIIAAGVEALRRAA